MATDIAADLADALLIPHLERFQGVEGRSVQLRKMASSLGGRAQAFTTPDAKAVAVKAVTEELAESFAEHGGSKEKRSAKTLSASPTSSFVGWVFGSQPKLKGRDYRFGIVGVKRMAAQFV